MMKIPTFAGLALSALPFAAQSEEARELFVESNVLAIFYHELGHAVIDLMEVPIFGQEEDAADVMSVLLIDWLFTEDAAQEIAYDSAFGYLSGVDDFDDVVWWGVHGPDEQRFYNHICLFFGGNPDAREELAEDLGLPEERAETCPEEYDLAAESWGQVFDDMDAQGSGVPMRFVPGEGPGSDIANRILGEEVARMSQDIALPEEVTVYVDVCDEANAFYFAEDRSITFCTEFIAHLREVYDNALN